MSERPFMQLYVSDFVGDTMMLSAKEIGAYMLLLMVADRNGGALPLDERKIARITRLPPAEFAEVWPAIDGYFEEADGFLWSNHLRKWARFEASAKQRTPLSLSIRRLVIERDGARCQYCGDCDGPFHIDHIHPVILGGTDDLSNLAVACRSCNLSKGAKTLLEWQG